MNFRDPAFLLEHIQSILDFYASGVIDPQGGFFQNFKDDGTVFNLGHRHLVSSCRMVFNYCKAYDLFGDNVYFNNAEHGIDFLRQRHWDKTRHGYHWTLKNSHEPDDQTNHCYGLAFVLLCFSAAHEIGITDAGDDIERVYKILETRFWDKSAGLYADEASPDWSTLSDYRGQNANMHCCEALLAAWEATGESLFLERARALAKLITVDLADRSDGLIWEHFTRDLQINWDYNRDDPKNLYRPWGFQPGHQTEWAKLLLILYQYKPEAWMVERARDLFDRVLDICWDHTNGGINYGFAPDGTICDSDKYFWVQAESFAASARLLDQTGDPIYQQWYQAIWQYAWKHMIDHEHGAWYRVLTENNRKISDEKSVAGGKCDYHTLGACWDILRTGDKH